MSIVMRDIATKHAKKVPVGMIVSVRAIILIRLIYLSGVQRRIKMRIAKTKAEATPDKAPTMKPRKICTLKPSPPPESLGYT